ncbi:CHAD domain-containing protein [Chromobacterium violaceum]|uniref:CHAD domain-containing protein n=1 Tax=Chromobacterium violaceum TaxID=536 RepID=UPI001BE55D22|nr:CHAD domain-containing protein [Chromobacterium violaceum]MBT2867695.1 CHAD domain-containing protein [Chromobacterium violaceum]
MAKGRSLRQLRSPSHLSADRTQARIPRLQADMGCDQALKRIALECLRHLLANTPAICEGNEAEPVHQARVAIRRLRTALAIFSPLIRGRKWKAVSGDLKWLAGILGKARDLDVLALETLPALQAELRDASLAPAAAALSAARQDSRAACRVALASRRWTALPPGLLKGLARLPACRQPALPVLANQSLKRQRKTVCELQAESRHSIGQWHELRKQGKKLRYAAEFFTDLRLSRNDKRLLGKLQALQRRLGDYNDAIIGREWLLRHLAPEDMPERLEQILSRRIRLAEESLLSAEHRS